MISVIIPIYNTEKYIKKTIISLINQTYKDFEIILVNDGTPDNAVFIAEKILKEYDLAYVIVNQENKGQGESRNSGVRVANGEWLFFLDSDDVLQPNTFSKMTDVINNNREINFVFSDFQNVDLGNEFKIATYDKGVNFFDSSEIQRKFLFRDEIVLAPGTLFNTEWYNRNNLKFKNIPYSEDQIFIWEALSKVTKVAKIRIPLYNYIMRPGSIMSSTKFEKIYSGYDELRKIQNIYINEKNPVGKFILSRWVLGILHSGAKLININEFKDLFIKLESKENLRKLLLFPKLPVKVSSLICLVSPKLGYWFLRRI